MDDATFCKRLPKTELHAHITGSIMPGVLHEIWKEEKARDPDYDLEDPIETLETARRNMDATSFFPLFSKFIYRLCNTKARIQTCVRSVLTDFARDGVDYLELRSIPRPALDITKEEYVQTVTDVLNEESKEPRPACTYLILSVDRKCTPEEALDTIELAIKYKDRGVIGIDLAGNPSKCDVTGFGKAYTKAQDAGLKITLHFAEMEWSSRDEELKALLGYHPDRLGHVINVPDWAKREITNRRIGLEICMTSNVASKLIPGGYPAHHFGEWRDGGECPIAICTDDVGIFRSTCSQEYELLMKHFGLDRREVIGVARSSVACVFGTEDDQKRMLKKLDDFEQSSTPQAR